MNRGRTPITRAVTALALVAATGRAAAVWADNPPGADEGLQEVVVTAQYRR